MDTSAQRAIVHTADSISAAAIVGTFLGYLPAFAALAAIIWYVVQIYESKTVQKWVRLRRMHRRHLRLRQLTRIADVLQDRKLLIDKAQPVHTPEA